MQNHPSIMSEKVDEARKKWYNLINEGAKSTSMFVISIELLMNNGQLTSNVLPSIVSSIIGYPGSECRKAFDEFCKLNDEEYLYTL